MEFTLSVVFFQIHLQNPQHIETFYECFTEQLHFQLETVHVLE